MPQGILKRPIIIENMLLHYLEKYGDDEEYKHYLRLEKQKEDLKHDLEVINEKMDKIIKYMHIQLYGINQKKLEV